MEERFERLERRGIGEDDPRQGGAVNRPRAVEDQGAEALDDLPLHLLVLRQQPVDDLVARRDLRPTPRERLQGFALSRADAAGDRDGERLTLQALRPPGALRPPEAALPLRALPQRAPLRRRAA